MTTPLFFYAETLSVLAYQASLFLQIECIRKRRIQFFQRLSLLPEPLFLLTSNLNRETRQDSSTFHQGFQAACCQTPSATAPFWKTVFYSPWCVSSSNFACSSSSVSGSTGIIYVNVMFASFAQSEFAEFVAPLVGMHFGRNYQRANEKVTKDDFRKSRDPGLGAMKFELQFGKHTFRKLQCCSGFKPCFAEHEKIIGKPDKLP